MKIAQMVVGIILLTVLLFLNPILAFIGLLIFGLIYKIGNKK